MKRKPISEPEPTKRRVLLEELLKLIDDNPVETENSDNPIIDEDFIVSCKKRFREDKSNIISKNVINTVGSMISTINSDKVSNISHIFDTTLKKKGTKATNQGASGRCWMFAGLNMFRHQIIEALNLENFEFSTVYLFFWDKLERSNTYLKWFIDHPEFKMDSREYDYMISSYMNDGGWWNTFANLVNKYGLVPLSCMKETFQSEDSEDMNKIISEKLDQTVSYIYKNRNKLDSEQLEELRKKVVEEIYFILIKFLGEPPVRFNWVFKDEEENVITIKDLSPHKFLEMVIPPELNLNEEFITLAHLPVPDIKLYTNYTILYTNNVEEGSQVRLLTVNMNDMVRYTMKSIESGVPVWFVGDVQKCFNWIHSTLDDKMVNNTIVYGENYEKEEKEFSKGDRIMMKNVQGNHAMCIVGFTMGKNGVEKWQVENSWGARDDEEIGSDGFLYMSNSWFEKYVLQITVHKSLLSRTLSKKLEEDPLELMPWESLAPALRTNGKGVPESYRKLIKTKLNYI